MPNLTPQQASQLTALLQGTHLANLIFTAPEDGYRLSATATYVNPGTPAFDLGLTWADNGHGTLKVSESINGVTVTPDSHTDPHHRIALNQMQRAISLGTNLFRYHASLAEMDAANTRKKEARGKHVNIAVPTTAEARASTIAAMNDLAANVPNIPAATGPTP